MIVLAGAGDDVAARRVLGHVSLLEQGHPLLPRDQERFAEIADRLAHHAAIILRQLHRSAPSQPAAS